ncbi:MAG: PIG-L family deacetylase [Caldilineaceae bacterium]|nr:PIG-L family deacetylase [Caldilineaceae bacterium]
MRDFYPTIYLSPHLDDVTLSCGGQVYQQTRAGQSVLIVTVTAGDPPRDALSGYAQSLHDRWALATDAVAARRAEDLAACRILGADALHWEIADCIYRMNPATGEPIYLSDPDIFGDVHAAEHGLVERLAAQMRALPAHSRLCVPLGVGHHVDHQLTRAAAEQAFGRELVYYEEYPYAQQPGAVSRVIAPGAPDWQAEVVALTPDALEAKFAAILTFESQLSTFFTDEADLRRQVGGYAASVGGERLWRPVHP